MRNFDLKCDEFKDYIYKINRVTETKSSISEDSVQYVFRFNNGFGASVVKRYSNIGRGWLGLTYGADEDLWELGVLEFKNDKYTLTYETDVTCDVEGCLTDEDVCKLLQEIKEL